MRAAIARVLATAPDVEAVGEAEDRVELLRLLKALRPAALILDPGVLGPEGLRSLPLLRAECDGTRIVVADFAAGAGLERGILRMGADAFVAKDGSPDAWLTSLRAAVRSDHDDANPDR